VPDLVGDAKANRRFRSAASSSTRTRGTTTGSRRGGPGVRPERLDHAPATSPPARADGSWLAAGVQQGHLHGSVLAPDRGLTSADQRLERAVLAHLAECARAAGRERMSRFPVGMYGRASRNGQRLRGTPLPVRGLPVCVYGGQAAGTALRLAAQWAPLLPVGTAHHPPHTTPGGSRHRCQHEHRGRRDHDRHVRVLRPQPRLSGQHPHLEVSLLTECSCSASPSQWKQAGRSSGICDNRFDREPEQAV
jgi:hypothetical protein